MPAGFDTFPKYLAQRAQRVDLAGVPAMVALPDGTGPAPMVLWLHGRTASKELDPGRYLRWLRAGIAAVALDLPGHGDRPDPAMQEPARTLDVMDQMLRELDPAIAAAAQLPGIDPTRTALGGMSLGGMVTLRRLADPHGFVAASVEGTCGWLEGMYYPAEFDLPVRPWPVDHPRDRVRRLDPARHLDRWPTIPILFLHSEADEMVPWEAQRRFIDRLRPRYGDDAARIAVKTWQTTGAPREHIGFGRFSNDAKNLQTEFLARAFGLPQGS